MSFWGIYFAGEISAQPRGLVIAQPWGEPKFCNLHHLEVGPPQCLSSDGNGGQHAEGILSEQDRGCQMGWQGPRSLLAHESLLFLSSRTQERKRAAHHVLCFPFSLPNETTIVLSSFLFTLVYKNTAVYVGSVCVCHLVWRMSNSRCYIQTSLRGIHMT